ncbi:MAG: GNAT family N-acetyltransferase [Acidimicrobiales bacterium]
MEIWGADRVGDLTALATAAMPAEALSADELLACCWDDPGVVLGSADGSAAVGAGVARDAHGQVTSVAVKIVAVHPGRRREGVGRALLDAVERWAWDQGAAQVTLGAAVPFYLWPGVDVRALAMSCLAEAAGYHDLALALNMSVPATFRAPEPEGFTVERVLEDVDVAAVDSLVARHWPEWTPETSVGLAQGSCFAAFDGERRAVGFACHSVNRAGWFGPTGTDPSCRGAGIGHALLAEVCRDAMVAGHADVEISWIGPMRFYAKAGGSVSRVFRILHKPRP